MTARVDDRDESIATLAQGGQGDDDGDDDVLDNSPDAEENGYYWKSKNSGTINNANIDDKDLLPNIKLEGVAQRWRRAVPTAGTFNNYNN